MSTLKAWMLTIKRRPARIWRWTNTFCWKSFAVFTYVTRTAYLKFYRRLLNRQPELANLEVLYRDNDYVVINKAVDERVNSDDAEHHLTVATKLGYLYPHILDRSVYHKFRFCHRLDYSTSGVLLIALNKRAAGIAQTAFQRRQVKKHYLALVRGHVQEVDGAVEKAIGRDGRPDRSHAMCAGDEPYCEAPRASHTEFVLLSHGTYDGEPASKLLLMPYTGRRHQLRVHCKSIGHVIIGDYTYEGSSSLDQASSNDEITVGETSPLLRERYADRMMLHSFHLYIPLHKFSIDVRTPDPFPCDSKWQESRVFCTSNDVMASVLPNSKLLCIHS